MNLWKSYYRASSVNDAVQALYGDGSRTCIIAGGTDLLLDMQQGRHAPVDRLVDVTAIPEMITLELHQGVLFIGAAVPVTRVVRSPLVQEHALALVEAADLIGGPQVRNTATLGGNVAHALPAGDGTIALVALGGQAEVAGPQGRRKVPMLDLYAGPGKSRLGEKQELLVGFHLPAIQAGQASAFARVMRPQGVALPILNLATWIDRKADRVVGIRIALGPAGPTPQRAFRAEESLIGMSIDDATISRACDILLDEVHFRTSPRRATAEYRRHLVSGLLSQVLNTAWHRAA